MKRNLISFLILLCLALFSCKDSIEGDLLKNKPPQTYVIVDTIIRIGENRLNTQLEIHWWGNDPDGFIKAYEFSFDSDNWQYTTRQDSIFLITIPKGTDTFDLNFYVRAIDNQGEKDPTPAKIIYPLKNSPPDVSFRYSTGNPSRNPVRSFPVIKFSWNGSDPDGQENLSHYELYWNDTTSEPFIVNSVYSSVIIEASNLVNDIVDCKVYQGSSLKKHDKEIAGLKLNDNNQLWIRAVDLVGEKSEIDTSRFIYVRRPSSNILLVNAYSSMIQFYEDFYTGNLNNVGINNYDITRLKEIVDGNYTELAIDNVTQSMIFNLFKVIIWFGKDAAYSMSLAQRTTDEFFNLGGKMYLAVEIATAMEEQASYMDFTPIDSLVEPPEGYTFKLDNQALIIPAESGWPTLKTNRIISSARPFYEDLNSMPLYDANILKSSTAGKELWLGKSTVMVKRAIGNKTNFIISSIELNNIDANNNLDSLFRKIFVEEFEL